MRIKVRNWVTPPSYKCPSNSHNLIPEPLEIRPRKLCLSKKSRVARHKRRSR